MNNTASVHVVPELPVAFGDTTIAPGNIRPSNVSTPTLRESKSARSRDNTNMPADTSRKEIQDEETRTRTKDISPSPIPRSRFSNECAVQLNTPVPLP